MPGGRPKKPIEQKLTEGTYRADRDGPLDGLVQAEGTPVPPASLQGEALAFWGRVVPDLVKKRVASACDSAQLAIMCEWWARYQEFSGELDRIGPAGKGAYQMTLMCGIACTNFDRIAAKFGLTPTDRAKLRADPGIRRRVPSRTR